MNIHYIFVTFNTDTQLLRKALASVSHQADKIYIIDNTVANIGYLDSFNSTKISISYLGDNMGIAYAQNVGIKNAIANGADYIILSDQDTVYPPDYVKKMVRVFSLRDRVAAVTPEIYDVHQNRNQGFVEKTWFGYRKTFPSKGCHEIYHAINSGQVLNVMYLHEIGLMRTDLFIDWVDYEWCWRAGKKGFLIIGNADVVIRHQLGEGAVNLSFKQVSLKKPIRYYYITRNAFYLSLRSQHIDYIHKLNLFIKSFRYIFGYPILSEPRLLVLKYVMLGFYHGVSGQLGRLD
jgi:rhamnosyltransferase